MTGAVVFLAVQMAPQTLGEAARRHLQKQLRQHYRNSYVAIGQGRYEHDVGFVFDDIRIIESSSTGGYDAGSTGISIDRVVVFTDFDQEKITEQQNPFVSERILIDGFRADTAISESGELSIAKLWPPPKLGPTVPRIEMRDAEIHFSGEGNQHDRIPLRFESIVLTSDPLSGEQAITARGSAPFMKSLVLESKFNPSGWVIQGQSNLLHISDPLIARLPKAWGQLLSDARSVDMMLDANFGVSCSSDGTIDYSIRTAINDGRLDHVSMPKPVSQIRGLVTCDPDGIIIQEMQGRLGDAIVRLGGLIKPESWPYESAFRASVDGLLLDEHLARRLPAAMRIQWDKIQPYGHIDLRQAELRFREGRWNLTGLVQAKGVNVRMEKCPYPAENLVGQIEITDGYAVCQEMNGRVGGRHMKCAFRLPICPESGREKIFRIRMDGPVAIDNTLINSLSPRGAPESRLESFVRSLHPQGTAHLVDAKFQTDADGRTTRFIDLRIVNGNMRYDRFAYPLYNVSGQVKVVDDIVWLGDFEANNSSGGQVACAGWYQMQPKPGVSVSADRKLPLDVRSDQSRPTMRLVFNAKQIAMDGSLRASVPENSRPAWDAISPGGVLDQLDVIVTQAKPRDPVMTDITAVQQDAPAVTNRTLSLQPPALPYRLDVLSGTVRFDGRRVLIDSIRTRHDATRVSADGKCVRGTDGRWNLMLNIHGGSRLHPDAELIAALPSQMRQAMHRLQLRGPLSIRGTTQMLLADATHADPVVDWNLNIQLEGNRIGDVGPVHSVRGELRTTGRSDAAGLRAVGDLEIDSMHINDLHLTAIKGPLVMNDDRLQLGIPATGQNESSGGQPITGTVFDGTARLSGDVVLSSGKFDVSTSIRRGQVPTLLADLGKGRSELKGTFNASSRLEGFLGTTELLKGVGTANVSGANLYQLPLIVQLLNLLRITPTEDVAFTDGNADFQIIENEINFSKLQLWGDLVALDGAGTLNRRRELDLTFNTRVSPQNSFTQLVRPLRSRKYTLLTVDVRGPFDAPMIQRRTFDGVSETLEKLFPVKTETAVRPETNQRQQQAKNWLPYFLR